MNEGRRVPPGTPSYVLPLEARTLLMTAAKAPRKVRTQVIETATAQIKSKYPHLFKEKKA